jgi:hypothetical protein
MKNATQPPVSLQGSLKVHSVERMTMLRMCAAVIKGCVIYRSGDVEL